MLRGTKALWPLVSRTSKQLPRFTRPSIQPATLYPVYRSFTTATTTTVDNPTQQPTDEWKAYCEKVENAATQPINAQDYIDMCSSTQADTSLTKSEKVKRLQRILRHIHQQKEIQPELNHVFQRACNMLMYVYISHGNLRSARLVFDGLADSSCSVNQISIRTIIHGIQKHGNKTELHQFIKTLEDKQLLSKKDTSFYVTMIYALKQFGDVRGCQFYFSEMVNAGLDTDETSYRAMMEVYRNARRYDHVLQLYHTMKEKNITISLRTYGVILSALSRDKDLHAELVQVYDELKSTDAKLPATIYIAMKWDPLQALKDMKEKNQSPEIRDYNEFLANYVKRNKFKEALQVYHIMKEDESIDMDVYSYGIVMDVLVKDLEQSPDSVFDLYKEMKDRDIKPDAVVYTSLLSACNRSQDLERAMSLLEEMEQYGTKPNEYTFNSILSILSTMERTSATDLDRASLVWDKMTSLGIHPDTRTYNTYLSIISKLIQPVSETEDQVADSTLWGEDEQEQHVPRTVREMLRLYRYMRRNHHHKIQPDFATYTIVINSLSAAGQLRSALQVYSDAKMSRVTLPVSAYNEIMRALQRGGKISEAMNVWYDMKIQGVLPDTATYEIVLEACEQLGLTDTLTSIRNQRKSDFNRLLDLDTKKQNRMKNFK
ncbi:hypothetical protein MFLAVUS_009490 [Mucor flavus]|uniref:Pentacotripeptide-repeat region of PRORP domain-containing protein n=1 Tax=Mucor flavus TaxID=439312 RepID=A0ABP9ZA70_9FUNG